MSQSSSFSPPSDESDESEESEFEPSYSSPKKVTNNRRRKRKGRRRSISHRDSRSSSRRGSRSRSRNRSRNRGRRDLKKKQQSENSESSYNESMSQLSSSKDENYPSSEQSSSSFTSTRNNNQKKTNRKPERSHDYPEKRYSLRRGSRRTQSYNFDNHLDEINVTEEEEEEEEEEKQVNENEKEKEEEEESNKTISDEKNTHPKAKKKNDGSDSFEPSGETDTDSYSDNEIFDDYEELNESKNNEYRRKNNRLRRDETRRRSRRNRKKPQNKMKVFKKKYFIKATKNRKTRSKDRDRASSVTSSMFYQEESDVSDFEINDSISEQDEIDLLEDKLTLNRNEELHDLQHELMNLTNQNNLNQPILRNYNTRSRRNTRNSLRAYESSITEQTKTFYEQNRWIDPNITTNQTRGIMTRSKIKKISKPNLLNTTTTAPTSTIPLTTNPNLNNTTTPPPPQQNITKSMSPQTTTTINRSSNISTNNTNVNKLTQPQSSIPQLSPQLINENNILQPSTQFLNDPYSQMNYYQQFYQQQKPLSSLGDLTTFDLQGLELLPENFTKYYLSKLNRLEKTLSSHFKKMKKKLPKSKTQNSTSTTTSFANLNNNSRTKFPNSQKSDQDKLISKSSINQSIDVNPIRIDKTVSFNSVGGLKKHIQALKEVVMLPLLYPQVFTKFGIKPPRGMLFTGPPGTGKTLVARALANSCMSEEGKKISFFMRKGSDILSKWIGEAERQLRLLFENAKKYEPSIIFFDEIDGLAPVRSSKQDQIHSSVVSTLLCLHKDTSIYLKNKIIKIQELWKVTNSRKNNFINPIGEKIQIKKINNNLKIYSKNKINNTLEKCQIKAISKTFIKNPIKIILKNNCQLICSENTKLLKLIKNNNENNNNCKNHNYNINCSYNNKKENEKLNNKWKWIFIKDIKINDQIAIPNKLNINITKLEKKNSQSKWIFNNNFTKFKYKNTKKFLKLPKYYSKELIILISLILKSIEFSKLNGIILKNNLLKAFGKKLIFKIFGKISNTFKNITILKFIKTIFKINWFSNKNNNNNNNIPNNNNNTQNNKIPIIISLLPNELKKVFYNYYDSNHNEMLKKLILKFQNQKNKEIKNKEEEIIPISIISKIKLKGIHKMYDLCTENENFIAGNDQPIIIHNSMMDGLDDRGNVVVIGATNRPDAIDPALRRPGRFDREMLFPLPNKEGRKEILEIHTKHWNPPLNEDFKNLIVKLTVGYCGADIKSLCTEAALRAVRRVYPQIYHAEIKLPIDINKIVITKQDFFEAMKNIVPSSHRSGFVTTKPLSNILKPLLQEDLEYLFKMLEQIFPVYLEKKLKNERKRNRNKLDKKDNLKNNFDLSSNEIEKIIEKQQILKRKRTLNSKNNNNNIQNQILVNNSQNFNQKETCNINNNNNNSNSNSNINSHNNDENDEDDEDILDNFSSDEIWKQIEEEEQMMNCENDYSENLINKLSRFQNTHYRPRLLIYGETNCGQNYLANAILHELDEATIYKINLQSIVGDLTTRNPEEVFTIHFSEALRTIPSVIFIPNIECLSENFILSLAKKTFLTLLKEIPSSTPILLLATCEIPLEELDQDISELFSEKFNSYSIVAPNKLKRKNFYKSIFKEIKKPPITREQLLKKRKKMLKESILNYGLTKNEQQKLEITGIRLEEELREKRKKHLERKIRIEEEIYLKEFRFVLKDLVQKLSDQKKFKMFFDPVNPNIYPEYYYQIDCPIDFTTIHDKIDSKEYLCLNHFLKDVHLIKQNTKTFKGWKNYNQINRKVTWMIEALDSLIALLEPELLEKCNRIAIRRAKESKPTKEKVGNYSFTFEFKQFPKIVKNNENTENNLHLENENDQEKENETKKDIQTNENINEEEKTEIYEKGKEIEKEKEIEIEKEKKKEKEEKETEKENEKENETKNYIQTNENINEEEKTELYEKDKEIEKEKKKTEKNEKEKEKEEKEREREIEMGKQKEEEEKKKEKEKEKEEKKENQKEMEIIIENENDNHKVNEEIQGLNSEKEIKLNSQITTKNDQTKHDDDDSDDDEIQDIIIDMDVYKKFKKTVIQNTKSFTVEHLLFLRSRLYKIIKEYRKKPNKNFLLKELNNQLTFVIRIYNYKIK
ncbi:intein-containing aaa domain-containing precursor [Anaeramoeba flamelloides]|uniref:Intein-containing aaa domain-containing n=1 Tax=Anaeramoeba flamelloides TaxID=1746091 RepID=A0AAV7ZPL3_9EUKA|nr:intein-containing aaa domain-containing precursor [Anaeramoeba flamelloides]